MPEESSAEDTANPSDMEELVQDPHQASHDAEKTHEASEIDV